MDRNIFSSLIKMCCEGKLRDPEEMKSIGMIMVWTYVNDFYLTPGEALLEYDARIGSHDKAIEEFKAFNKIFDYYPPQIWLEVACGRQTEIPTLPSPMRNYDVNINLSAGSYHYGMILATMIHLVILFRNKSLSPVDKFIELYDWILDNVLICKYVITYAAMLFTNQEYIKAPQYSNSNDIDKIISGCKNQSWDIAYLSEWSVFYMNTEDYQEEYFFTTSDKMLKRIFINTNSPTGVEGLLCAVYSKKDYLKVMKHLQQRMERRQKPDFGDNPVKHFERLIDRGISDLEKTIEKSGK